MPDVSALADTHRHVPVPGELVSPVSGRALVTISRALGEAHIRSGGSASFVARAGMPHRPEPLGLIPAGLGHKVWLTRREKVIDRMAGTISDRWIATDVLWEPVYDAIPEDHCGLVFLHNAPAAAAGLRRRRPDAQGVVYLHNITRGWPRTARRRLVAHHRVVCDSRFLAERLDPGAAARGAVQPLVNGADVRRFRPRGVEVEPTVLFVGRLEPQKGPHLLIEAACILFEDGLRFRLRIVGSSMLSATEALSPFQVALRDRAQPLGGAVEFVPFVDRGHIADLYADATIMVVPSTWLEPCSLTLPEGMAAGLACVASRRGGLPEVGADAPLYFDPGDVGALVGCLRRLLTDDDERRARAAAARRRAEEISWDVQLGILKSWLADGVRGAG